MKPDFPDGKRFAFTILDDTDDSTLENVRPVYERLREYGFRTTKTVWPEDCPEGSRLFFAADTLQRPDYLAFVHELRACGFEIASHGATMESSRRKRTEAGLSTLRREFGEVPRLHANHGYNRDNVYWGAQRFQTPLRGLLRLVQRVAQAPFEGADPQSPYYWGDLCHEHVDYVRNFTTTRLDSLAFDPQTPYHVRSTPCVKFWFSTSDAPDAGAFKRRVTPDAIDRLERAGGACILSTHLGKGFARDGRIDPEIDATLRDLAARSGWFVPVSTLLDHLRAWNGGPTLGRLPLLRLEIRYLMDRVRSRGEGGGVSG